MFLKLFEEAGEPDALRRSLNLLGVAMSGGEIHQGEIGCELQGPGTLVGVRRKRVIFSHASEAISRVGACSQIVPGFWRFASPPNWSDSKATML